MKINWKYLATTKGYQTLKAAYIHDVKEATKGGYAMRNKDEFLRHFRWVICRAKHYVYKTGKSMEVVLGEWESKRDYWWLNYYQSCRLPRFHSGVKKPMGIKGIRAYYKNNRWGAKYINDRVCDFIKKEDEKNSTKKKKRWPMTRKSLQQELKKYL